MSRVSSPDDIEICEEVGRGGFGVVYRGIIKYSGKVVAVKELDLEHDLADIYEINQEIQILSECKLPQITQYLGCVINGLKLWLVMEFADGGLLYELLQEGPISDENLVASIAREILLALDYLHRQGKIHRDLKSQNILFTREGHVKLTDFGVSTQLFSSLSRRNTTVGTPYWMSPEVIVNSSGGHNHEADIWSLGCCIYEVCTGKPPLQERLSPMQALRTISGYKTESDFWSAVGVNLIGSFLPSLHDFLRRCMIIDPASRPSAGSLLTHNFVREVNIPEAKNSLAALLSRTLGPISQAHPKSTHPTPPVAPQDGHKSIHFDFSTIKVENVNFDVFTPPSLRQSLNQFDSPMQPYTPRGYSTQRLQLMRNEFEKVVDRSLHKLDQRTRLLLKQYNELSKLNESMLQLFEPVQSIDNGQSKLLIGQYLKNVIKDLSKKSAEPTKSQLSRSFLPSNLLSAQDIKGNRANWSNTPMDDVERSLLTSWIESMSVKD